MGREATNKILDLIDEGVLDRDTVIRVALMWMSEDSVREMAFANEIDLGEEFDEEYEDDGQPDEAQEWADFGEVYSDEHDGVY